MTPIDWNDSEPTFPDFLPPARPQELTGRRRYVRTPLGLVLQIEYSQYMDAYGRHACFWRDAVADDVLNAETVI